MGRQPCCDKVGLKKGPWTIEEDHKLMTFILNHGIHCWRTVPKLAGLLRCGKSCRLRWINYLRPDLKRGALTETEEDQIIQLHQRFGNRWSKIASHFPGRTDNEIKNHWNTRIKKRLKLLGLDPLTHQPLDQEPASDNQNENENQNEKISDSASSSANREAAIAVVVQQETTSTTSGEMLTETAEEETDCLVKDYETLSCWNMAEEISRNLCSNSCNDSSSNSFCLEVEDSVSPCNVGDSSSIQSEDSLQQWVETLDSFLWWDNFNYHLQDQLFF